MISDNLQRKQALNPTESFIVSAPAGSGKTGLLTQRFLRLLGTVGYPEEILAITFTQKAATEMSRRIYESLHFAANNPRPVNSYEAVNYDLAMEVLERDRRKGWCLLSMPNRLRVKTIDSFSRYIATQFSIDAGLLDVSNPSDNPEPMYLEASREVIAQMESKGPTAKHIKLLAMLTGNNLNRLENLLAEMLPTREQWLPIIFSATNNEDYFINIINNLIEKHLLALDEALLPVKGEIVALADYAAQNVDPGKKPQIANLKGIADMPSPAAKDVSIWKALTTMLVTDKGSYRKSPNKNDGFPTSGKDEKARINEVLDFCRSIGGLEEKLAHTKDLPDANLSKEQKATLDALAHVLPMLAAELNLVFKKYDTCDFTSITLSALNALEQTDEGVSDITLKLDYNLKHILIDEFQDTSIAQVNLIGKLVDGWVPGDGRSLFLVGDAMQSLYSFRNANVSLFASAQKNPIGPIQCTPLTLSSNFRSEEGIVNWINNCFERSFPTETNTARGAIPYSPASAVKESSSEENPVTFIGFTGSDYEHAEAKKVAQICKEKAVAHPKDSIAILVKSRSHLKQIIPELLKVNCNWEAVNIDPLESRMSVQDVISLTRALSSVADRIAWLSVLRAPYVGLTLEDIIKITNSSNQRGYSEDAILEQLIYAKNNQLNLSARGERIIRRVVPILMAAHKQIGRMPLRFIVEKAWLTLGGAYTLNDNDHKDVRQVLELIEQSEESSRIRSWKQFDLAVKKLFGQPLANLNREDAAPIQIMTIHAAKGLEFDHVILPGLSRVTAKNSNPLMQWHISCDEVDDNSLLIAPLGAHDADVSPLYEYLRKERSEREIIEQTRVMYVAATRAIRTLTLTSKLKSRGNGYDRPTNTAAISRIWPKIDDELACGQHTVIESSEYQEGDQGLEMPQLLLKTLPENFNIHHKKEIVETTNDVSAYKFIFNQKAQSLGSITHAWIQQICTLGVAWFEEMPNSTIKESSRLRLSQMGMVATSEDLDSLCNDLRGMTSDAETRKLLSKISSVEVEVFRKSTQAEKMIIDATYVDNDNSRVLVDWKTSAPREGESEESFLNREVGKHREKILSYANSYRSIDSNQRQIKTKLYFVKLKKLFDLELDSIEIAA